MGFWSNLDRDLFLEGSLCAALSVATGPRHPKLSVRDPLRKEAGKQSLFNFSEKGRCGASHTRPDY